MRKISQNYYVKLEKLTELINDNMLDSLKALRFASEIDIKYLGILKIN